MRVLGLCLVMCACDSGKAAPAPSRVVSVSQSKKEARASELCDVLPAEDSAPSFVYPALRGETPSTKTKGYHWLNVWATWCPPCIEELPLLTSFRDRLEEAGAAVTLSLLSVDETPEVVHEFARLHPEVKNSLQVKDSAALEAWLPKVGLDGGATLPIHLLVDAGGKVRCARTGALRESDFEALKQLVSRR